MTEAARASRTPFSLICRYAYWLARLQVYKSFLAATILGILATLSLPPVHFWQILYVVFPSLVWLLAGAERRRTAFALGWWFGFGLFSASLYWIGNALLISAGGYGWLLPLAFFGLPALFAFYSALATLTAWYGHNHLQRGLLFACAWVFAEWLRGHLFTGFPWNLIGYSWAQSDEFIQAASVFGIYGVSLIVVLSATLPSVIVDLMSRRIVIALFISITLPAMTWIGGGIRLNMVPAPGTTTVEGVGLRIVQPSIPQNQKWPLNLRQRNMERFLDASQKDRPSWITHIIWPETAATFFIEEDVAMRSAIAAVVPRGGLLLTGGPRRQSVPAKLWNSLIAIDGSGLVVASYDKTHLVPFGEYIPFRKILPMDKIVHGLIDYSPGDGIKTLHLLGLPPVSVVICYEVAFPGQVMNRADPPAWILNVTNDAWYGETVGPHQHLAMALVRAVEEGRPLIRATNTGISAVIDAYGRTIHNLGLNTNGVIDSRLPVAITGATLFASSGELGIFFLLFGALLAALLVREK